MAAIAFWFFVYVVLMSIPATVVWVLFIDQERRR